MSKAAWIIFSVAVVGLLGALIVLTRGEQIDLSNVNLNETQSKSEQSGNISDHVSGSNSGDVVLIEYLDYQCPGCAGAHPRVRAIMEQYGEDVTLIVRHFPVPAGSNSRIAAASAEAAGMQDEDKFWQMHNLLLSNQSEWGSAPATERTDVFVGYAEQLDLDADKFRDDLSSPDIAKKIAFDRAMGVEHGVTGTPSFFLGGESLDSEVWGDEEAFKEAIEQEISQADTSGEATNRKDGDEDSDGDKDKDDK